MQGRLRGRGDDGGFALVEVIVAITLLALIMLSVTGFFLRGSSSATAMQRRQAATALADQALELIRSVPAKGAPVATSLLVDGRTQAGVNDQWTRATAEQPAFSSTYLSTMTRAWDTGAVEADPETVPYSWTATVSDQPYRVDAFLGTCARASTSSAQCTATGTGALEYRAVVLVSWTSARGQACGTGCTFVLASLIDPQVDQVFMVNGGSGGGAAPVARPDSYTTPLSTSVSFNVKSNDSGSLGPTPVTLLTSPAHGALTPASGATNGGYSYAPTGTWCGPDGFRYRLSDVTSPPRTSDTDVSVRTSCGTPLVVDGSLAFCKNRANLVRLVTSVPGVWSSYTLSVGATTFEGTATLSATQPGYVDIAARNGIHGVGPWTLPLTFTFPDGQTAGSTLTVTVDIDPTC